MKKILSLFTIFVLLGAFLVACAKENQSENTRAFDTVKGVVYIPVDPQRIVSDYYLGEFLALDVKPIIASPYALDNPFLSDYVQGIARLDVTSNNLEMIASAEPDLIVTMSEADYANFSKIAPTVLIPYDTYNDEDLFIYIGDMLGRKIQAESYYNDFKIEVVDSKENVNEIVGGKTISFIEMWANSVAYSFGNKFARGGTILFDMWELKAPELVQTSMVDGKEQYVSGSLEMLIKYTGDFIFYGVFGVDKSELENMGLWQSLPAVQNNQTKYYNQTAFMHSDPISLQGQFEFYLDYFNSIGD